jgi:hypothetical protein
MVILSFKATPEEYQELRRLLDLSAGSEIEWALNEDGSVQVRKIG